MSNYYNSGTVSVANGATTVTGSSVLWSDVLAGDTLELAGQRVMIASVTDTTHVVLANAWTGTTQSGAAYLIRFDAPSRFTSGYLAEQVRALIARAGILEAARPTYEVQSLGSNTPPGSPVTNDMYVVGTSPTGAWAGRANNLAQWTGSAWLFTAPDHGITVVSVATGIVSVWNGTAWTTFQTALGYTPVNKAGDTLTGALDLPSAMVGGSYHLSVPQPAFLAAGANISFGNSGLYVVQNASTGSIALFLAAGTTVTLVASHVANQFSTSNGTANRINFFYFSTTGVFVLQNSFGASQALSVFNIRTRSTI